MIFTDYQFW